MEKKVGCTFALLLPNRTLMLSYKYFNTQGSLVLNYTDSLMRVQNHFMIKWSMIGYEELSYCKVKWSNLYSVPHFHTVNLWLSSIGKVDWLIDWFLWLDMPRSWFIVAGGYQGRGSWDVKCHRKKGTNTLKSSSCTNHGLDWHQ